MPLPELNRLMPDKREALAKMLLYTKYRFEDTPRKKKAKKKARAEEFDEAVRLFKDSLGLDEEKKGIRYKFFWEYGDRKGKGKKRSLEFAPIGFILERSYLDVIYGAPIYTYSEKEKKGGIEDYSSMDIERANAPRFLQGELRENPFGENCFAGIKRVDEYGQDYLRTHCVRCGKQVVIPCCPLFGYEDEFCETKARASCSDSADAESALTCSERAAYNNDNGEIRHMAIVPNSLVGNGVFRLFPGEEPPPLPPL